MSGKLTFTEQLRRDVATALGCAPCPTCGRMDGPSNRAAATIIGVNQSTLWRFLVSGKQPSGPLVDQLVAWLEKRKAQRSKVRR